MASTFEVAVVGLALALPASLFVAVDSIRSFAGRYPSEPEISVFLALDANSQQINSIKTRLRTLQGVEDVQFVPRKQALEMLRRSPSLAEVLDALPSNPLPDAFTVKVLEPEPSRLEALRDEIATWPQVEIVRVDAAWAKKVQAAVRVGQALILLLASLFGAAALAVTYNTVRLQLLARRDEIELSRLIGATNGYIRRPFVYFGGFQGLLGGAAALAMISAGTQVANQYFREFSVSYGTTARIEPVPLAYAISFLVLTAALGSAAAWIAANRSLSVRGHV